MEKSPDWSTAMEKLRISNTFFEGVMVLEPLKFSDDRGFFLESYHKRNFELLGITENFVQDNHSCSRKGVIRGLHFQSGHPQGKLVKVFRGSIYDVIVDIRKKSPKYGKYIGIHLDNKENKMVYVPVGFAHGFLSLEDQTEIQYKTTDFYHPEYDAGIRWNDPDIGIAWPLQEYGIDAPLLSAKDASLPLLRDVDSPFQYPPKR